MNETISPSSGTGDNLSIIRLIAAIVVIYGHAFPLTGAVAPGYLGSGIQTIAVKVFFVISGMLITDSWLRDPNAYRYLQRRLLRIVPALAVLGIVTVFIIGPIVTALPNEEYFSDTQTYRYLWNLLFYPIYNLPGVFGANVYPGAVNGSLWTLPVEMAMYIATPVVLLLAKFSRLVPVILMLVIAAVSIMALRTQTPWEPYVIYGTNLWTAFEITPYFLAGMAISTFKLTNFANIQVAFIVIIIAPFLALSPAIAEITLLFILPFAVISFAYADKAFFAFMDKKPDISYGVYLYGFLFQQIVSQYFAHGRSPEGNFMMAIVPTIIFAYISCKFIEEPALKLKPRRSVARQ